MIKWNLLMTIIYSIIFQYFLTSSKNLKQSSFIENYYFNQTLNTDCPENCFDGLCDNTTLKCDSCIDGYYTDDCSIECPTLYCLQCDQEYGQCQKCKDDLIIIDNYCCDNFCKKCNDNGCTECIDDTEYGSLCIECPVNCYYDGSSRKCDQDSGNCYSCISGKTGTICDKNCNVGCDLTIKNCDMNDGSCECKEGFYGEKCENNCDENCEKCDSKTGICSQCISGYYPKDLDCLKCPENCDGECPEGKCQKCKDGFYGEICDKMCSIFCEGKICEQKDGLCDCINHFSKESYCTQCLNKYDLKTNCTQCQGNYDVDQDCVNCLKNYDLTTDCETCINYYDLSTNCQECLNYYDLSTNCQECLNHYDITTNCQECLNHFSESSLCQECEMHFTIESDCTQCEGNYDLSSDCKKCVNHYDISSSCEKCDNHYSLDSKCTECEKNYDLSSDCKECLYYFDISTNCQDCLNGYFGEDCNEQCYEGCDTTDSNCRKEDGYCEKCYFPYYGEKCEYKADVEHCVNINKTDGQCVKCEETFYLTENKTCEICSINCKDFLCEDFSGKCFECDSLDRYGDTCDKICSKFCNKTEGQVTCDRENGECNNGCINDNFYDVQCTNCKGGFFPQEEGCNRNCSEHCLNKVSCDQTDGSCQNCIEGYWSFNCTKTCNEDICDTSCEQKTGKCENCVDGYYYDKSSDIGCSLCPTNCNKCENKNKCNSCKEGKYGIKCEEDCSKNCNENRCDINGNCQCKKEFYGEKCSLSCFGCADNGCNGITGICIDHYCSVGYFDPRMCNKTCGDKCGGEGKCDLFTGECISCDENKWGVNCESECPIVCEDDGRVDCCYAKESKEQKAINIELIEKKKNNNLGEEQDKFYLFNINLGGFDLIILADFETNSPLVIFDSSTEIKKTDTEIYNISIDLKYNSSNSSFYVEGKTYDVFYEYDGFSLIKEKAAKDKLVLKNQTFDNFTFLICQEYKIEKEFDNAGKINGIVGLGLRNYFTENLFWNDLPAKLPKNILILNKSIENNNNKKLIHIGDYTEEIKKSFSKLSTMEILNKKEISMNKLIRFETSFTGIAYSMRKAYQYQLDKNVILDDRIETTIVFNNLYKQFFEKIYFGELFENGCYYHSVQGGEGEYYCDIGKKQAIQNLPKLGLILGDYIYYLSYHFLYKESGQFITFIIKLHGQSQQRIELGKSFFNEFSVVYNNGNETLNFFGDIKKLNVPLKDPSNLLNIDSNIFSPGGWVTLIVFITALLIIICYLSKYCFKKNDNDESDEDEYDEDDDEGALIDDTLE